MVGKTGPPEGRALAARPAGGRADQARAAAAPPLRGDAAHEAVGEAVRFTLRVGPQHVVAELVVDGVDPLPLRVVLPPALPALGMDQVNVAVLVGPPGGLAPVEVFEPAYARAREVVEAAEEPDRPPEVELPVLPEEAREQAVDRPALANSREHHAHGVWASSRPPGRGLSGRAGAGRYRRPRGESMMRETRARHGF